eukprot:3251848-Amphidinium_carterae.1
MMFSGSVDSTSLASDSVSASMDVVIASTSMTRDPSRKSLPRCSGSCSTFTIPFEILMSDIEDIKG